MSHRVKRVPRCTSVLETRSHQWPPTFPDRVVSRLRSGHYEDVENVASALDVVIERAHAEEDYRRRLYLDPAAAVGELGLSSEMQERVVNVLLDRGTGDEEARGRAFELVLLPPPFPDLGGPGQAGVQQPRRPKPGGAAGGAVRRDLSDE